MSASNFDARKIRAAQRALSTEQNIAATEAEKVRLKELEEFAALSPDEKERITRAKSIQLKRAHAARQPSTPAVGGKPAFAMGRKMELPPENKNEGGKSLSNKVAAYTREELEGKTKDELRAIAAALNTSAPSRATKDQLVKAIRKAQK